VHVDSKVLFGDLLAEGILQQKEWLEACLLGSGHQVGAHEVEEDIHIGSFQADERVARGKHGSILLHEGLGVVVLPPSPSSNGPFWSEASHVKDCEERSSMDSSPFLEVLVELVGLKELAVEAAIKEELGLAVHVEERELLVCIDHERSEHDVSLGILLHGSHSTFTINTRAEVIEMVDGVGSNASHGRQERAVNNGVHQASCSGNSIVNTDATLCVDACSVVECNGVRFNALDSQRGAS